MECPYYFWVELSELKLRNLYRMAVSFYVSDLHLGEIFPAFIFVRNCENPRVVPAFARRVSFSWFNSTDRRKTSGGRSEYRLVRISMGFSCSVSMFLLSRADFGCFLFRFREMC